MKKIISLLLLTLAGRVLADGPIIQSSPYMRQVLTAPTAAAAQTALGFTGASNAVTLLVITNAAIKALTPATTSLSNSVGILNVEASQINVTAQKASRSPLTNNLADFGAIPNAWYINEISVTNRELWSPQASWTAADTHNGLIIAWAGVNGRWNYNAISNVIDGQHIWLSNSVALGVTNEAYCIEYDQQAAQSNSIAFQNALNCFSNSWGGILAIHSPYWIQNAGISNFPALTYWTTKYGNFIGQAYAFSGINPGAPWQNVNQNDAMFIVPPLLANSSPYHGGNSSLVFQGDMEWQPWGSDGNENTYLTPQPNATVLLCAQPGTDANDGTNGIGPSFIDFRPYNGPNSGFSQGPFGGSPEIPENSCHGEFDDITVQIGFDAQKVGINYLGAAEGKIGENLDVLGTDLSNYPYDHGLWPVSSNSIAIIGGGNGQGFFAMGRKVQVSEQYIGFECGQIDVDYGVAYDCSNALDFSYTAGSTVEFPNFQSSGCINAIDALIGRVAAPAFMSAQILNFSQNILPVGTPVHVINDQYWQHDGIHDSFSGTVGDIIYSTNQNRLNGSPPPDFQFSGNDLNVWLLYGGVQGTVLPGGKTQQFGILTLPQLYLNNGLQTGGITNSGSMTAEGAQVQIVPGATEMAGQTLVLTANGSDANAVAHIGNGSAYQEYWGITGDQNYYALFFQNSALDSRFLPGSIIYRSYVDNNKLVGFQTNGAYVATGGYASYSTNTITNVSVNGCTNTTGVNIVIEDVTSGSPLYISNTVAPFQAYKVNMNATGDHTYILKPNWALIGSAIVFNGTNYGL